MESRRHATGFAPDEAAHPQGERIYAIGDIHGLATSLDAMMAAIEADLEAHPAAGRVTEIFLGDYVDRGPDSRGVIERLMAPPAPGRTRITLVGNHEEAMLAALADPDAVDRWMLFRGGATARSYGVDGSLGERDPAAFTEALQAAVPDAHVAFLLGLPLSHRAGDFFFVHAGIRPGVPLERQTREDLVWIRDEFLSFDGPLPAHIVHGHTPVPAPDHRAYQTNIDTGACYGGDLTAAVFDGEEVRFLAVPGARSGRMARL